MAEAPPILEPLQVRAGFAEELQLHLLELPGPEGEVARGDLIAEGFANLAHAEGQLPPGGPEQVVKVHENALSGLRPEVDLCGGVLGDALVGFEHQIKLPDVGEVGFATAGAGDLLLPDVGHQTVVVHRLHIHVFYAVGSQVIFNELVRPVPHFAGFAVDERVIEGVDVARSHPDLRIHQNGGVLSHVVGALLNKLLPPGPLDVVFQLHTQGTVIPGIGQSAINL